MTAVRVSTRTAQSTLSVSTVMKGSSETRTSSWPKPTLMKAIQDSSIETNRSAVVTTSAKREPTAAGSALPWWPSSCASPGPSAAWASWPCSSPPAPGPGHAAGEARGEAGKRVRARQGAADQGKKGAPRKQGSALHQIDAPARNRAWVAEEDDQDREADGGPGRRDGEHQQREDLADE